MNDSTSALQALLDAMSGNVPAEAVPAALEAVTGSPEGGKVAAPVEPEEDDIWGW